MKKPVIVFFCIMLAFAIFLPLFLLSSPWIAMDSGTNSSLKAIWGMSPSDIFAVGDGGTILYYNGSTWVKMDSTTSNSLEGIWGSNSSDVFVVGQYGTILHYDGSIWTEMTSNTTISLHDIWGSSYNDIYAVGDAGTILHYDGNWSTTTQNLTDKCLWGIGGSSPTSVAAVGLDATLYYNGSEWSTLPHGVKQCFFSVWVSSSDIFIAGYVSHVDKTPGCILHYNDSVLVSDRIFSNVAWFCDIWGTSSVDIFAVGTRGILHYDGNDWSEMNCGTKVQLNGVWGTASDVYAVGVGGTILHYSR